MLPHQPSSIDNKTLDDALNTPLCECGCGQQVKYNKYHSRRYIHGHHRRGKHMLLKIGRRKRFSGLPRICKTCNKDIPLNQQFLYAPQQCGTSRSNTWVKNAEAKKPKHYCKCGCGTLISTTSRRNRPKFYVHGHAPLSPSALAMRKYREGHSTNTNNGVFCKGHIRNGKLPTTGIPGVKIGRNNDILIRVKGHPRADKFGYVGAHILMMEDHLGRYLNPWEFVSRKNGLTRDNRIQNLRLRIKHTILKRKPGESESKMHCSLPNPQLNIFHCNTILHTNEEALQHMRETHGLWVVKE
jgi:hypothetical protein